MLKTRQRFDKYRIEKQLGHGGFAKVYQAYDTIEGVRVALKIPYAYALNDEVLKDFRKEVRLTAQLDHPNILPMKNACFIDKMLVIVYPLGEQTLADRLASRMSLDTTIDLAGQILEALAYAHRQRIIHCDVKPENFILFPGNRIRLTDFGISKFAFRTIEASGSGTVGYLAPEQAMGRPSFRSDVFSAGLVLYRMFSGHLPTWPFAWPFPGLAKLRRKVHPDFVSFLRRALELNHAKRHATADQMLRAFLRLRPKIRSAATRRRRQASGDTKHHWQLIRHKQFTRQYGVELEARYACKNCGGPISESMFHCPWCGRARRLHEGDTSLPIRCPRCNRGMKLDWRYCPWCYGAGVEVGTSRTYSDKRYVARCTHTNCPDGRLMKFMRYCPWCHDKVSRTWMIKQHREKCSRCGWGVLSSFWEYCPWCGKTQEKRGKTAR